MSGEDQLHRFIAEYQSGQISDGDFATLESILRESPKARALFHRACRVDASLRREAENVGAEKKADSENDLVEVVAISSGDGFRKQPFFKPVAAAAAVVLLSALTWTIAAQKRIVATLVSSEDAVWERSSLTESGASFTKGALKLSSGIVTIRSLSGVEVTLEAPARLYMKGPSRAVLNSGTVVVKSQQDDEFILETEFGQVTSVNGSFAAFAIPHDARTDFEAISGKVTISHDISREVTQLTSGGTATMFPDYLESSEVPKVEPAFERFDQGIKVRTGGRAATFIRNNHVRKWTRPDLLTLKTSTNGNGFDQRVVIGFDLSQVAAREIEAVNLRLNLVHSGNGLISRLPKVNRFSVFGLVSNSKEDWSVGDSWEDAPSPGDGELLSSFEISRSQTGGEIDVSGEALLKFIRDRAGSSASLILIRDTANLDGEGPGYTHAIASDSHPEAFGPVLDIVLKN